MNTKLIEALTVALDVTGTKMSEGAVKVMVSDLAEHPETDVLNALQRCRRECKFRMTLADVLERMPGAVNADAAWEQALAAGLGTDDETETVITTRAIIEAFPFSTWQAGDRVGARMAFKAAYPDKARAFGGEALIFAGWDAAKRETKIREAVSQGLLTMDRARKVLPEADWDGDFLPAPEALARLQHQAAPKQEGTK